MDVKKFLAGILACAVVGGVFSPMIPQKLVSSIIVNAEDDEYTEGKEGVLTYRKYEDHIEISKCDEEAEGEVIIPDTIEGLPVTSIGELAFSSCESLESIIIPDSVTSIGRSAFGQCISLKSIVIPNGITSIDEFTFVSCGSLESITIPNSVTSIGDNAFWACDSLKSITIPDSVTSIGVRAFCECTSLESINIPGSVANIGKFSFYECTSLEYIDVAEENKEYCSIDGVVYNNNATELIIYPTGKKNKSFIIPDGVTSIDSYAFGFCSHLKLITLPNGVTSIGDGTFWFCNSLESITIPNSVISIGDGAFWQCSLLKSVILPDSVTSIGEETFMFCNSLESITIPANVTSIGYDTFSYCQSLESIIIENPDCEIYDDDDTICNGYDKELGEVFFNGTIYGHEGSTAQAYAEKYGYKFEALGAAHEDITYGDANDDGEISIDDAVLIMQALANPDKYGVGGTDENAMTEQGKKNADCFDPGSDLTAKDALAVQRYLLKSIEALPEKITFQAPDARHRGFFSPVYHIYHNLPVEKFSFMCYNFVKAVSTMCCRKGDVSYKWTKRKTIKKAILYS